MNFSRIYTAAAIAISATMLTAGGALAADYVVLESNVGGIEPGLVSAGDATIVIPDGGTVVLIDPAGETRIVAGPYTGAVSDTASAANSAGVLEQLTASRDQEKTSLGAVRAPKFEGGNLKE